MANDLTTHEKVDVVIAGAGASGSTFAAVLAKAGKKVVLLDNGPDWQLTDLISSDIWGRRIKPAGPPFILEGKVVAPIGYHGGWGVGGAALHWFANVPRLLPNDFKIKSEHNRSLDWPISYDDVAPWYDTVAHDIGISGDAKAETLWRPAGRDYPMPPMKTFKNGEVWKKGFEANDIRLVPAAVAMNSVEFKGRAACIYDGWCHVGCPIGALANPQVTYLGEARAAGAEVRGLSTVTRILTDASGKKATGVEYYDAQHGKHVQPASVVIAASWAAQNPRLLLNSANRQAPERSRQCERARRQIHHDALHRLDQCAVRRGSRELQGHDRRPVHVLRALRQDRPQGRVRLDPVRRRRRQPDERPDRPAEHPARPVRRRAARLHEARRERLYPLQRRLRGAAEDREPRRARRPEGRVRHAARPHRAQLRRQRSGAVERQSRGRREDRPRHRRQGGVAGPHCDERHPPDGRHHHGHRAGNSVVDSYGQTHEIPNLYVAGPGIFPTCGASNPTYTIFALSLRGAEHLAKTWSTVAG